MTIDPGRQRPMPLTHGFGPRQIAPVTGGRDDTRA
jgi:hypothetical protein